LRSLRLPGLMTGSRSFLPVTPPQLNDWCTAGCRRLGSTRPNGCFRQQRWTTADPEETVAVVRGVVRNAAFAAIRISGMGDSNSAKPASHGHHIAADRQSPLPPAWWDCNPDTFPKSYFLCGWGRAYGAEAKAYRCRKILQSPTNHRIPADIAACQNHLTH